MADIKFNTLSMDTGAVMDAIENHYFVALELVKDALIMEISNEAMVTMTAASPGKKKWRSGIASLVDELDRRVSHAAMEMDVGIQEGKNGVDFADVIRATLIAYGSGDKAVGGGEAIHRGPEGREVWDDDMSGRHPSNSKSEAPLPEGFNQLGNDFFNNAFKKTKKHFNQAMTLARQSLPSSVFFDNVSSR